MKTILFFGDSNTWGYHPKTARRFPLEERFTEMLSKRLPGCRVIVEGLNGRTTATDDELGPLLNGKKALPMILCSHDPIDQLVIMLGTNDVKCRFNLAPVEIAQGLELLVHIAQTPILWGGEKAPEILVVCPACVSADVEGGPMYPMFDQTSIEKSKALHPLYEDVAKRNHCGYLNANPYVKTGSTDGVHLELEGHQALSDLLYQQLKHLQGEVQ